jgi:pseudouridine-5'-phosphate glycosidase
MPWPQNYETALQLENIVREGGAIPATIAVLNGKIHIGLEDEQLRLLAQTGQKATKISRRDLALAIAKKQIGATTVSATSLLAAKVGIHVFATGGIGGVHRGVEATLDISADLTELGRTPILVVCSGVKSILDIPKTLEYLETQGVGVVGYKTSEFPAFFTRKSGSQVPARVDSAQECAEMIYVNWKLNLGSGFVVAVPIHEDEEAQIEEVEKATQQALSEADAQNIKGRDITPFLLGRIAQLTSGESLRSNICLVKNNARVASKIACALSKLNL